jgi:hypothetical protein
MIVMTALGKRLRSYQQLVKTLTSVVEPKLFVSAPAPTFKKFRLRIPLRSRLRQQLWNYLLSQI